MAEPKAASTLTALAVLKVNWDELGRDYVENFVPLAVECLRVAPDDAVSLPELQKSIQTIFGLELPLNPLRLILRRLAQHGYVRKESNAYFRSPKCATFDFSVKRQRAERQIDLVATRLVEFAQAEYELEWSPQDAEASLLAYVGEYGLELLYASAEARPIIQIGKSPRNSTFVVSGFVADASKNVPSLFNDVESLAKGTLLANAVYLPDQGRAGQNFTQTKIYFDTQFIIAATGHAGPERAAPALELIALLGRYGAELRCFQMTIEEARGILDAAAERLKRGRFRDAYGSTMEFFIVSGYSASDIELMSARLPNKLKSLGILVESKPNYEERQYQVDEAGFEQHLAKSIGYKNPKALKHDVDCISAIARIRRGRESFSIETAGALFVTTNSTLARASRTFFQSDVSPGAVAFALTDYSLGNLLWLKNPTKAPDLPRKRLLADAMAAMQPPDGLWLKYLAEIARLQEAGDISADDYYVLRYSLSSKATLMRLTLGDDDAFTEGTVTDILELARENIRADVEQSLREEQEARRHAEETVQRLQEAEARRAARIGSLGVRIARLLTRTAQVFIVLALALGTLYTFPWSLPAARAAWQRYAIAAAQALVFVYTIVGFTSQGNLASFAAELEAKLAARVQKFLDRLFRDELPTNSFPAG